nr:MAG TPA: hypothetical protein [Caudoviricetes sp.]
MGYQATGMYMGIVNNFLLVGYMKLITYSLIIHYWVI